MHCKFTTTFTVVGDYSPRPQFHHFRALEGSVLQVEAQQGPDPMEPLFSRRPWIEVDAAP